MSCGLEKDSSLSRSLIDQSNTPTPRDLEVVEDSYRAPKAWASGCIQVLNGSFSKNGCPRDPKGYRGIIRGLYKAPFKGLYRGYIEKYPNTSRKLSARVNR